VRIMSEGPTHRLGAAGVPTAAKLAAGYQSHGRIAGSPGTDPIPAPAPASVPQGVTYRNDGNALHASDHSPEVWFPGIYYYGPDSVQHPPVSVQSDNQLPMPAIDPKGLPTVAQVRPTFLRQNPVPQPASLPAYGSR
jgi:hypothetical protein